MRLFISLCVSLVLSPFLAPIQVNHVVIGSSALVGALASLAPTNSQHDISGLSLMTLFIPELRKQQSSEGVFYHFCHAGGGTRSEGSGAATRSVGMPLYLSEIFPVPRDKNINRADVRAFAAFLGDKYDPYFKGLREIRPVLAACRGNETDRERARADKVRFEDNFRHNAQLSPHSYPDKRVIETGWKWQEN